MGVAELSQGDEILVDDVAGIESVLKRMWRAAEESAEERGTPPVRLCLGNLAVIGDPAREAEVRAALDELGARRPARAVVAWIDDSRTGGDVRASVRAVCHLPAPGQPQVCCEQIELRLGPEGRDLLPGIVLPLIEPDLPSLLWWDRPVEGSEKLLKRLAAEFGAAAVDLDRLGGPAAATALRASGAAIHDLSWARIECWRRAIAHSFDDPDARAMLPEIRAVSATAGEDGETAATLLLGWLAAQLGWEIGGALVADDGVSLGQARAGSRKIKLKIARSGAGAGISSVAFEAGEGSSAALARCPDSDRISIRIDTPRACAMPRLVGGDEPGVAAALGALLESSRGGDRVFSRALDRAIALAG